MKYTPDYRSILVFAGMAILLAACHKGQPKVEAKQGKEDRQPVMVEILQPRALNEYISVSGKLEGSTDITMTSETSGRLLELYKKLGDKVYKGEKIGQVDNEVYRIRLSQAEAAKNSAEAALETAQLNLNSSETLFHNKTISQVEYNGSLAAFKAARANLDGAEAGLESARKAYENSFLVAPEAGTISNLMVSLGQYINTGTPVAYITDNKYMLIKTGVGESQIGSIKQGQSADVFIPGRPEPVKGFIKGFGMRPMAATANYPIEIQLPYSAGLLPGMVVSAKILSGHYTNLLYTSINSVVNEYDHNYVYVVSSDNIATRKEVKLGRVIGEDVILASGVNIGDRIVVSGMENLEDNTPVQVRN